MNNQIDPITVMLFFALICSVCCTMAAYNFGKADGRKQATDDWNELLNKVEKNNKSTVDGYKELIDELMLTIENKSKIIEEFKKLHIEDVKETKKEPVQRLWKVGDKFTVKGDPYNPMYTVGEIIQGDAVKIHWTNGYTTFSCKVVDSIWGKEWILVQDTNPSDGC